MAHADEMTDEEHVSGACVSLREQPVSLSSTIESAPLALIPSMPDPSPNAARISAVTQQCVSRAVTRSFARGPACGTRSGLRHPTVLPAAAPWRIQGRGLIVKPRRDRRVKLGRSGCGNMACACDVGEDGFEIAPLQLMTRQVYINATERDMKDEEMREDTDYWRTRIFHRGKRGYDTSKPRSFSTMRLFSRCLPADKMPRGSQLTVGFGSVTIRPSVDVTFPPAATGAASERYESKKPHICIRYDRSRGLQA